MNHSGLNQYPAPPQALPQPQPTNPHPSQAARLASSGYGATDPGVRFPTHGPQGPVGSVLPFGRGSSPPEIRPIESLSSPRGGPHHAPPQFPHHQHPTHPVGIAAGAPAPAAALAATEAAARDRDDRPMTGIKRAHETDEEMGMMHKHAANGDNKSRLEDSRHRRPSPPDRRMSPIARPMSSQIGSPRGRAATPPVQRSRNSSTVRREEQRRADESYYPSEAAHHPPTLPSMQMQQQQQQQPPPPTEPVPPTPMSESGRDVKKEAYEAASRKMEVDEDYDDEGEEEKRKTHSGGRESPQRVKATGPVAVEAEA